jgi:hypothetical protein
MAEMEGDRLERNNGQFKAESHAGETPPGGEGKGIPHLIFDRQEWWKTGSSTRITRETPKN